LAKGEEPFPKVMGELETLAENEGLILLSPFLPSPLIEHLKSRGFAVRSERLPDGSWQTSLQPEST
jgi:uncharacterized protein (DUF2249 family)